MLRGTALLLFIFCNAAALAQSGESRMEDFPRIVDDPQPQGGIPIPYGEELDSPRPVIGVPGIVGSELGGDDEWSDEQYFGPFVGSLGGQPAEHTPHCCEYERGNEASEGQPRPRTGPQYEYQNIGEPWDSYARLLRARDERQDADRNLERREEALRDAGHEMNLLEMYPEQYAPDPLDEYGAEIGSEYRHARDNRDAARDRADRAQAEEAAAESASGAAVAEYAQWEASQPRREYPPYEGQPVKGLLPEPEGSRADRGQSPLLRDARENSARADYYETINKHADGDASIEDVEAAYRELRNYR